MDQPHELPPREQTEVTRAAMVPAVAAGRLACMHLHPLAAGRLADWPALLDGVAAQGFTHVILAPPFRAQSVLLADDLAAVHPALDWAGDAASALAFLDAACRARGLSWMLDVVLDRVAARGAVARAHRDVFATPRDDVVDPYSSTDAAHFAGNATALADFWSGRLREWQACGAAGFRLLGLEAVPPDVVRRLCDAVHGVGSGGVMLGWTHDLSRDAVLALAGCGLDRTGMSLESWDFRADWFWDRIGLMRRVAPALVAVESPFGARLAATVPDAGVLPQALARAVRTAAAIGSGWLMTMGFDTGTPRRLDPRRGDPADVHGDSLLGGIVAAANAGPPPATALRPVTAAGLDAAAFAVGTPAARCLGVINPDLHRETVVSMDQAAAALGAAPPGTVTLAPGAVHLAPLVAARPIRRGRAPRVESAKVEATQGRIGLERVAPAVDDGRFAAKRTLGDWVAVEVDIICDGHDKLAAVVQWRAQDEDGWREVPLQPLGNDRWGGRFLLERVGLYLFRIQAWRDAFASFRDELAKKFAAGLDVKLEAIEGRNLVEAAAARRPTLAVVAQRLSGDELPAQVATLLSPELAAEMAAADDRPYQTTSGEYKIDADRIAARFASWYEVFPRSLSDDESRHGTFADVVRHLPRIRDMGFDVLYFPPIHPIGRTNRKGRNNALRAAPDDPGSPYGIGAAEGGHDAVHPELGTLEDFRALQDAAAAHGLELALDFAIQASPDHPWLRQHPGWFAWRPDGSMRYAENPPKKYEDIVNLDFFGPDAVPGLWVALCEVVLFWVQQGVRTFRVDNPHTKPLPFWEWLIAEVRGSFPDTIFLAEAFTRPKVMNRLGKIGFAQSYTYFTWRNTKRELQEYLTELSTSEQRDFFRPNFFVNTPDINPPFLQTSGRPGFLIRAALAATLSGLWGVYNGFDLCEGTPLPGKEEYLDSEKYQLRKWDWDRPGNIVAEIARLNEIRRQNPALQTHLGVTFLPADNDQVMFFEKATPERDNVVLVAISLDPRNAQSAAIEVPMWRWSLPDHASLDCLDLVGGNAFRFTGKYQRATLSPDAPYAIWRARPAA